MYFKHSDNIAICNLNASHDWFMEVSIMNVVMKFLKSISYNIKPLMCWKSTLSQKWICLRAGGTPRPYIVLCTYAPLHYHCVVPPAEVGQFSTFNSQKYSYQLQLYVAIEPWCTLLHAWSQYIRIAIMPELYCSLQSINESQFVT